MSQPTEMTEEDYRDDLARRLAEIDTANAKIAELITFNRRAEIAISVMQDRIAELEVEIINLRCALREARQTGET